MNEAKVYITQIPSSLKDRVWVPIVDITPVREFGEPRVMTPPCMNYGLVDDSVIGAVSVLLKEFRPQTDFFLPMGDPLLMAMGAAALGAKFDEFKMLKWDRHSRRYFSYTLHGW